MSICSPFTAIMFHSSSKCIGISNLFPWLMALFWSTMPLVGWSSYAKEDDNLRCSIDWNGNTVADKAYIAMLFISCYLIPCSIMLLAFIAIKFELHQTRKRARNLTAYQIETTLRSVRAEKRHTKLAIVMAATFITLWTPYALISFWAAYFKYVAVVPVFLGTLAAVFAKMSTLVNPIIYSFLHPKFRQNLVVPFKGHVFRSQNPIVRKKSLKQMSENKRNVAKQINN